jgi:L-lactate dehydrogenase complex protein LldE
MRVSLFVTCLTDLFFPDVGESLVRVLHRLGVDCDFPPEQTCCGQPALNSGFIDEAKSVARRMMDVFEDAEVVVTPSGSCCSIVREHFPHFFEDDPALHARAVAMADKTFEFSEFLLKRLEVDWSKWDLPYEGVATFHYSCHNRGIGMAPEDHIGVLRHFRGLEYRELEKMEQCCGFGGTFAVKYGDISGAMLQDKIDCVKATGANILVCNDGGCSLNIVGGLKRQGVDIRTKHVAEMLDEAMRAGDNRQVARSGAYQAGSKAIAARPNCGCSHESGEAGRSDIRPSRQEAGA